MFKEKRKMQSQLKFYQFDSNEVSNCGEVLSIEFSNRDLDWKGVILEKGSSPHFYPNNVYTPYFYFALALEHDLHWRAESNGNVIELQTSPGNIWINPPKTPFTHNISEPCHFVILAIEESVLLAHCPLAIEGKKLSFLNNYNVVDDTIKGIVELFMLEAQSQGRNGATYLKSLLSLLASHYVQNYSNFLDLQHQQLNASKFDQRQVDKIEQYIEKHIGSHISIEALADLLGCSKFYFLREFKKVTGVTPYQYLMNKRLSKAKTLLSESDTSIASVSLALGFSDQSHFTRAFKNQFGQTPGQFLNEQK